MIDYAAAVEFAQVIISHFTSIDLKVDGVFGRKTALALAKAPAEVVDRLADIFTALTFSLPLLVSDQDMKAAVEVAAKANSVDPSLIWEVVKQENPHITGYYMVEFSGTFRGVGQFNKTTWASVTDAPWSDVNKTAVSLDAVAKLAKANKQYYDSYFTGPFTPEVAYLYHNQGAPAATEFLQTGRLRYPDQSSKALALFDTLR